MTGAGFFMVGTPLYYSGPAPSPPRSPLVLAPPAPSPLPLLAPSLLAPRPLALPRPSLVPRIAAPLCMPLYYSGPLVLSPRPRSPLALAPPRPSHRRPVVYAAVLQRPPCPLRLPLALPRLLPSPPLLPPAAIRFFLKINIRAYRVFNIFCIFAKLNIQTFILPTL